MPGRTLTPRQRGKKLRDWFMGRIRGAKDGGEQISRAADYVRSVYGKGASKKDVRHIVEHLINAADARAQEELP